MRKGSSLGRLSAVDPSSDTPVVQLQRRRILCVEMADHSAGQEIRRILSEAPPFGAELESLLLVEGAWTAGAEAIAARAQDESSTVLVVVLPDSVPHSALELLNRAWLKRPELQVLLVGTPECLAKLEPMWPFGAQEFCLIPLEPAELLFRVKRLIQLSATSNFEVRALKEKLGLQKIIGQSSSIVRILARLPTVARSGATLLIQGETGTGKELFAQAIHYLSERSDHGFVAVNCGAIPVELLENELFGHVAGAFTGAAGTRAGMVEEAEGGTLFLDEVDALPLSAQVKLLRLLQEKEYRPLGSGRPRRANVRVVAASNQNLEQAINAGRFRRDLYYRLEVLSLHLPALRQRAEDVLLLAEHFVGRFRQQYRKPSLCLTIEARQRLLSYNWPGNVRQLENILERAAIMCSGEQIRAHDIEVMGESEAHAVVGFRQAKAQVISHFERDYLCRVLALCEGNITQAARAAGKNRRALFELIRKHQIAVQSFCARS